MSQTKRSARPFEKLWKPLVYIRTEDGTIEHGVGVIWDETAYDPYTIEEQTITGTLKIDGYSSATISSSLR